MADVKIPGIGELPKKYVIGAGVATAGLVVIVMIRRKKNAASASASTGSGTVTDPAGNTCAALDPNSGYCPGSPEDQAYQMQATGNLYGSGYDGGYGGGGGTGISTAGLVTDSAGNQCTQLDPVTGMCPGVPVGSGSGSGSGGSGGSTGSISTNSDWLRAALGVLPGGDTSANEAALAGVLGGLTVTTAQKNIFLEAVGIIGQPPGGYPQPIKTSDTAGHPGGPGNKAGAISNLQEHSHSGTSFTVGWNPAQGATGGYAWSVTGPVSKRGTTKGTSVTVTGLKKGSYNFGVQGLPGGPGNNIHVSI